MSSLKQTEHPGTEAMFGEALGHHRAGRLGDADRLYRQILAIDPQHADSLNLLGSIGHSAGQLDAAAALIRRAIRIRRDVPAYYNNLANILKDQGKFDEAIGQYKYALSLNPHFAEAHFNLGCVLHDRDQFAEAALCYERAIALQPGLVRAHINLGNAIKDRGRIDEAVAHYERALAIDPGSADAHYNLATTLKDQGKIGQSLAHYRRALDIRPDHAKAHNNLGVLLRDQGQFDEAIRHFQKATATEPKYADAHVNEAMTLLLLGNMKEGWRKYEWRWQMKGARLLKTDKPLWDGSDLKGKTILLHGEQGLGDCIQFIRYAPMVKNRGGKVILACPSFLSRLFKTMDAVDHIVSEGAPVPYHDCHAPLMSLPGIFGTAIDTVPNSVPYLFPYADQVAIWAERLQPVMDLKAGLVWAGKSRQNHPSAQAVDRKRSMHIDQFAPLGAIPGIRFFSLQKGDPARQLETPPPGLDVIDYMDDVRDFADTAAFIANLDLVIGVDTSVIHLAGAMGKPVWVLSRFDGCWRWLQGRDDSPWYPTMRLFAQPKTGDWQSVIDNVRMALRQLLSSRIPGA